MSNSSKAVVGDTCYGKAVPGAYGHVVLGRVRDDVKGALGSVIEKALREALIKHVGIDLASPDNEVRDGDRVLLPGGDAEELPEMSSFSSESVDNIVEVLGVDIGDLDTSAPGAMSRVTVLASELRVRLGGVLQSLTGDGCDDFAEGIRDLEGIAKEYSERPDKRDSLKDFLSDVPNQGQLCELFKALGVDWEAIGSTPESQTRAIVAAENLIEEGKLLRGMLIDHTGRDPGTDLTTDEILRGILDDHAGVYEKKHAIQDRVQALLLRLTGECGEGLTTETMIDRIEASLGPVPEF